MKFENKPIRDQEGVLIFGSIAVVWRNNAIWLCTECSEFLEYWAEGNNGNQVVCTKAGCKARYEINLANINASVVGIRRVRRSDRVESSSQLKKWLQ